MHHFLESWLPRCTIKTPAYRHNRRTKLSSNRTRNSSKKSRTGHASTHWTCEHSKGCKSVNCHRNGPKLGPIRLNHRSEHSALRAWTPVARTAPLWSQMGMPSPCPDSISLLQNCISATPCKTLATSGLPTIFGECVHWLHQILGTLYKFRRNYSPEL